MTTARSSAWAISTSSTPWKEGSTTIEYTEVLYWDGPLARDVASSDGDTYREVIYFLNRLTDAFGGWEPFYADGEDGDTCMYCLIPVVDEEYGFFREVFGGNPPLCCCLDCAFNWWVDQDSAISPIPPVLIDPERNPWLTSTKS